VTSSEVALRRINYGDRATPDFSEFLRLLGDRDVCYLVISGYAVGYHGYPRTLKMPILRYINNFVNQFL
jgi:hypothetical protein